MKNLPMLLLAAGAAIIGLSFFMGKERGKDDGPFTATDRGKALIARPIVKNPGGLNVREVRIATVTATYARGAGDPEIAPRQGSSDDSWLEEYWKG